MSKAYSSGVEASLPHAAVTFDKFHVVSLVNNAVEHVRRLEQKTCPQLAGSRYVWLKNPANLNTRQWEKFHALDIANSHLKTARAYRIRLVFQELYNQPDATAQSYLDRWYFWATHSRLQPVIYVAKTIRPISAESSAGSSPASTMESSKASTVSSRLQKPKPAVIDPTATSPPSSTSSPANST